MSDSSRPPRKLGTLLQFPVRTAAAPSPGAARGRALSSKPAATRPGPGGKARIVFSHVPVGETLETASTRVHRFRGGVRITDLTFAGKRGKKAAQIYVETDDEQLVAALAAATRIDVVQTFLQLQGLAFSRQELRAIDVPPKGHVTARHKLGRFTVILDHADFSIRDDQDPNLTTLTGDGVDNAAKVRRWLQGALERVGALTLSAIWKELRDAGVRVRQYCAMD